MSKEDKIRYKEEGARRMEIRKEKRNNTYEVKNKHKFTHDEYSCPSCGLNSLHCHSGDCYDYICPNCNITFETPES